MKKNKPSDTSSRRRTLMAGLMTVVLSASIVMSPTGALAAEEPVSEPDAAVAAVAAAVETAKTEFDAAVQAAEDEVAQAQTALDAAQTAQESAKSDVSTAEDQLAQSLTAQTEAEQALEEIIAEKGNISEDDVLAAEEDTTAAEQERDQAWTDYSAAISARDTAVADLDAAQTRAEEANEALSKAQEEAAILEAEKDAQQEAYNTLMYEHKEALQQVENDPEYRALMESCEEASKDQISAMHDQFVAQRSREAAEDDLETAQDAQTSAETTLAEKQAAVDAAKADLDAAYAAKESAEAAVAEAEAALAESDADYQSAKNATEAKAAEAEEAERAVEDARAALTNAELAVTQAETALSEAQQRLDGIQEIKDMGSLGFVNWMLAKEGLTDAQRRDLESAKALLESAMDESFRAGAAIPDGRKNAVIDPSDPKDASTLENTAATFDVLRRINELRVQDDNYTGDLQRSEGYTNFYFMAAAQTTSMRGAILMNHSVIPAGANTENLAWGYSDPTVGWYNQEKAAFDRIKAELGISEITSAADINAIASEAGRQGIVVGHYTNLMFAETPLMGVGYNNYSSYRRTFSFNSADASRSNLAHYTIDDFESLFNEYCDSFDVANLQQAITAAETAINDANATRDEKMAAVQAAQEAAAVIQQQLEEARSAETAAQETISVKQAEVQAQEARASEAQAVVDTMLVVLEEAEAEVISAENDVAAAKDNTETAQNALTAAQQTEKEAADRSAAAEAVVREREDARFRFNDTLSRLYDAVNDAYTRLSETVLAFRQKQTEATDAAAEKDAADTALIQAAADVSAASENVTETEAAFLTAQSKAAEAAARSIPLRSDYDAVTAVMDRLSSAKKDAEDAEAALLAAQNALNEACRNAEDSAAAQIAAQEKLSRATALSYDDAIETPITDEDFAYLNEYIEAVLDAQRRAEEAQAALEEAENAYAMLSGDGAVWVSGSDEGLSFHSDGDYSKFVSVFVDGEELSAEDYTSAEGSTIVNLNPSYLSKLSTGEHSIRVEFTDGDVGAVFSVRETADPAEQAEVKGAPQGGTRRSGKGIGPKTGDEAPIVPLLILGVVALVGLVVVIRFRKVSAK